MTIKAGAYTSFGYRAAAVARRSADPIPQEGSGDAHLRRDRDVLARIADSFDRDNSIYEGILNRAIEGIVGHGFSLRPRTGDDELDAKIRRDWQDFAKDPEVRGIFTFHDCEKITARAVFNHGDLLVLKTRTAQRGFRFQYVESAQVAYAHQKIVTGGNGSRRVEEGVELDGLGRPTAYFVAPRDRFGFVQSHKARRIPADRGVLVAHRKRYSQTRGVPVLVSTFPLINRINDVCDSEAIAWQLLSKFAVSISRQNGPELAYEESSQDQAAESATSAPASEDYVADVSDRIVDLDEAIIFHGNPGETVSGIDRSLPGANFPNSVRMYLRLIGLPLGLPLELILLDWSATNYTGSRAALEQAFRNFVAWQRFLKRSHHSPLYLAWLEERIAQGHYPDTPDTRRHEWDAPEFPWVDQLAEAKAWGERMDRGLATQTQALKSSGMDRDDWLDAKDLEVRSAIERAQAISEDTGELVPWQIFCGQPVSKLQTIDPQTSGAPPPREAA